MTTRDNLATVLNTMTDDYIHTLRQGTSTRKPKVDKSLVTAYKPTKKDMKALLEDYSSLVDEIDSALGGDEELLEAWDFLSKTKLNHLISFATIVRDFLESNSKITRYGSTIRSVFRKLGIGQPSPSQGGQQLSSSSRQEFIA